jgi:hypothetical protein
MLKDGTHPYMNSWSAVEDVFVYSLKIDFDGNEIEYRAKRRSWNIVCLGQRIAGANSTTLERIWAALSPELKRTCPDPGKEREREILHGTSKAGGRGKQHPSPKLAPNIPRLSMDTIIFREVLGCLTM